MNQTNTAFDRRATSLQKLDRVVADFRLNPGQKAADTGMSLINVVRQTHRNEQRLKDFRLKWRQYLDNKAHGIKTEFPFPLLRTAPPNRRKARRPWMIHRLMHDLIRVI